MFICFLKIVSFKGDEKLKNKFLEFLVDNNFYPIEDKWNHFSIIHKVPIDEAEKQKVKTLIENHVGKKNGIYVYKDLSGNLLYIGKAKSLRNRLFSHYRECYETVPGDTKDNRWHRFFLHHQGELTIYWIEIEDEKPRRIIEEMLDYLLEPKFNEWK